MISTEEWEFFEKSHEIEKQKINIFLKKIKQK